MRNELTLPYFSVRKARSLWGSAPSGLGFYDVAAYLLIGRQLEQNAAAQARPCWILDLGTFFGHSAFALLQGAKRFSPSPAMRILSVDIFRQPDWIRETLAADFLAAWGPDEFTGVKARVTQLLRRNGLPADAIRLRKQDVLSMDAAWLERHSEPPFDGVAIDCGKTPELMNRIVGLLCDPRVTRPGTVLMFQDLFDWHAPWNAYAFWAMLKAGNIALRGLDHRITPIVEVRAHNRIETVCDHIQPSHIQEWCDRFTDLAGEKTALKELGRIFSAAGCREFSLKIRCLEVGALLRAGRLGEAEALIEDLDRTWPLAISDASLQNAWSRFIHVKTGSKDLSLRRQTEHSRLRAGKPAGLLKWVQSHADALAPLRIERPMPQEPANRKGGFRSRLGSGGNVWQPRTS